MGMKVHPRKFLSPWSSVSQLFFGPSLPNLVSQLVSFCSAFAACSKARRSKCVAKWPRMSSMPQALLPLPLRNPRAAFLGFVPNWGHSAWVSWCRAKRKLKNNDLAKDWHQPRGGWNKELRPTSQPLLASKDLQQARRWNHKCIIVYQFYLTYTNASICVNIKSPKNRWSLQRKLRKSVHWCQDEFVDFTVPRLRLARTRGAGLAMSIPSRSPPGNWQFTHVHSNSHSIWKYFKIFQDAIPECTSKLKALTSGGSCTTSTCNSQAAQECPS